MKNFFPFNTFSVHAAFGTEHLAKICPPQKTAPVPYEYVLLLADFFQFAPKCLKHKNFDKNPYNNDISPLIEPISFILHELQKHSTIEKLASFCLDICKPYKYPDNSLSHMIYDDIFSSIDLDLASLNYLLLSHIYNTATLEGPVTKILEKSLSSLSTQDLKRISGKFSSQKRDLLLTSRKHPFAYPLNNNYFYNQIYAPHGISINKKVTPPASIYEFIITAGLYTTPFEHNPFVQLLSSELFISPEKLGNFLNHFYLNEFHFPERDQNFVNLTSYIIERITNINLINRLYKISIENDLIPSPFYLLANYPLVSTRLKFLDLFCPLDNDSSLNRKLKISTIAGPDQSLRLIDFRNFFLHQTFFYFPLLINLFHLFLNIKSATTIHPFQKIIFDKNICPTLTLDTISPTESFPSSKSMSQKQKTLYQEIQQAIYTLYAEQTAPLIDINFIYDKFNFHNNPISFVENITSALPLTNNILNIDDIFDSNKNPRYINFKDKNKVTDEFELIVKVKKGF